MAYGPLAISNSVTLTGVLALLAIQLGGITVLLGAGFFAVLSI